MLISEFARNWKRRLGTLSYASSHLGLLSPSPHLLVYSCFLFGGGDAKLSIDKMDGDLGPNLSFVIFRQVII